MMRSNKKSEGLLLYYAVLRLILSGVHARRTPPRLIVIVASGSASSLPLLIVQSVSETGHLQPQLHADNRLVIVQSVSA